MQTTKARFTRESGIAIGPILFIIAILAVLAAAIAAGSGSFTGGTTQESTKTKATAIIQMGQNLKLGWDRITANGIAPANIVIDPAFTSASNHMFSPSGGGITPPSNAFADNGYIWGYNIDPDAIMGQYSAAVLAVSQDVCKEINRQLYGVSISPYILIPIDPPFAPDDPNNTLYEIAATWQPTGIPQGSLAFCGTGQKVFDSSPQAFFIQYFVL